MILALSGSRKVVGSRPVRRYITKSKNRVGAYRAALNMGAALRNPQECRQKRIEQYPTALHHPGMAARGWTEPEKNEWAECCSLQGCETTPEDTAVTDTHRNTLVHTRGMHPTKTEPDSGFKF